ncbi:MAG: response regulator [Spirochaetota bacterium]
MVHILVVEDNEINSEMLSRRLRTKGFQVSCEFEARQAIELAQSEKIDIILMDLNLPDMDGWEASRVLKQTPVSKDIPIIAFTALALPGEKERAIENGCDDFEPKPLNMERLLQKIHVLTQS